MLEKVCCSYFKCTANGYNKNPTDSTPVTFKNKLNFHRKVLTYFMFEIMRSISKCWLLNKQFIQNEIHTVFANTRMNKRIQFTRCLKDIRQKDRVWVSGQF